MSPEKRVTIRDIAAAAKVSHITVSRALRDDPHVLKATRDKIRALAEKMGYQPDPMLSALMAYRQSTKPAKTHASIAYVTNWPTSDEWMQSKIFRSYFEGARARGQQLGYQVEHYWLKGEAKTQKHASQILYNRGIKGLIIAPLPKAFGHLRLDWEKFAAVSLGMTLIHPTLHYVTNDQFQSMRTIWHHLRHIGYRRIGLAHKRRVEARVDYKWLGAHLVGQYVSPGTQETIPPLVTVNWNESTFMAWFSTHKPDVVISSDPTVPAWLKNAGISIPQDVGWASIDVEESGTLAGINQHSFEIGAAAVNLLHGSLLRGEYGVPVIPRKILINGSWVEGQTVRRLKPLSQRNRIQSPLN